MILSHSSIGSLQDKDPVGEILWGVDVISRSAGTLGYGTEQGLQGLTKQSASLNLGNPLAPSNPFAIESSGALLRSGLDYREPSAVVIATCAIKQAPNSSDSHIGFYPIATNTISALYYTVWPVWPVNTLWSSFARARIRLFSSTMSKATLGPNEPINYTVPNSSERARQYPPRRPKLKQKPKKPPPISSLPPKPYLRPPVVSLSLNQPPDAHHIGARLATLTFRRSKTPSWTIRDGTPPKDVEGFEEIQMDTPGVICGTTRGIVKHLTKDHLAIAKGTEWLHISFEN